MSAFGRKLRVALVALGLIIVLPAAGAGLWAGIVQVNGNVHEVVPGQFYRSAQLDGAGFRGVVARYNIRSIINLRGTNPNDQWYRDEIAAAKAVGAAHIDIPLSSDNIPSPQLMQKLEAALQSAPRPMLVHCQAGADRTGLASALFELVVLKRPASEAQGQLSFFYGHFPWLGSKTIAMDEALAAVVSSPSAGNEAQ